MRRALVQKIPPKELSRLLQGCTPEERASFVGDDAAEDKGRKETHGEYLERMDRLMAESRVQAELDRETKWNALSPAEREVIRGKKRAFGARVSTAFCTAVAAGTWCLIYTEDLEAAGVTAIFSCLIGYWTGGLLERAVGTTVGPDDLEHHKDP